MSTWLPISPYRQVMLLGSHLCNTLKYCRPSRPDLYQNEWGHGQTHIPSQKKNTYLIASEIGQQPNQKNIVFTAEWLKMLLSHYVCAQSIAPKRELIVANTENYSGSASILSFH